MIPVMCLRMTISLTLSDSRVTSSMSLPPPGTFAASRSPLCECGSSDGTDQQ